MRARTRDLTLPALAALSALVIHQLAYVLATPFAVSSAGTASNHGSLSTHWALVTPAAVVAASVFVLRQVRSLHLVRGLHRGHLTLVSASMFLGQEVIETGFGGADPLSALTRPSALIGLALAPLVAAAMSRILREASELVARLLRPPAVTVHPESAVRAWPACDAAPFLCDLIGTPSRGPPRVRP